MLDERLDYYYSRLSKEDGDTEDGSVEESCSISSQRACIQRYIRENFSSETEFEEISDDGFSGTNMNRPGIQKLLRLVEAGKVRTIIVRDLSRLARNYLEAGHYLEFVFPLYDVRFISINDHFDSQELGESTGGLELAIRNLINEMYSKDISRKIKSVVDIKKLNGEYVYGTAPYGYKKGEKKNTIVIDTEVAGVVKQIFIWASEGVTITQIAGRLNEAGVMTPSVYLASVRGKYKTRAFWNFESVRNILANRIYTGDTEPFKSHVVKVGSNRVKQIPPEERQIIPNTHEAIISREMYYQAQLTIKSVKKSKPTALPNPLTSLLICGCCGNRLAKGKVTNKNWLCTSARYQPDLNCAAVRVNEEKIKGIILRAIVMQCKLLDAKIQKVITSSAGSKDKRQLLQSEMKKLHRQLDRIQAAKMQYYEDYVTGTLCKDDYLSRKAEASGQEESLKLQMQITDQKLSQLEAQLSASQNQISAASHFAKFQDITELTPELTRELIKRVLIYPDEKIRIEWNFCDEVSKLVELEQFQLTEIAV